MANVVELSFPGNGRKNYRSDISVLTRSIKGDPKTGFCRELSGRGICGVDFDAVKDAVCSLREGTGFPNDKFCSADCFVRSKEGDCCFIEFKKSTAEALDSVGEELYEGKPIGVSLRRKAFDSLVLAGMTVAQNETGAELMGKAVFIVVYRGSAQDALSALGFGEGLSRVSGQSDSIQGKRGVRWGLSDLKTSGLYKDVHTWPDSDFVPWAKETSCLKTKIRIWFASPRWRKRRGSSPFHMVSVACCADLEKSLRRLRARMSECARSDGARGACASKAYRFSEEESNVCDSLHGSPKWREWCTMMPSDVFPCCVRGGVRLRDEEQKGHDDGDVGKRAIRSDDAAVREPAQGE